MTLLPQNSSLIEALLSNNCPNKDDVKISNIEVMIEYLIIIDNTSYMDLKPKLVQQIEQHQVD